MTIRKFSYFNFLTVCSSYIIFPSLAETKHLSENTGLKCSKDDKLISFDHSITLTGIKVFFENTIQRPNLEFECHLDNQVSTVVV